MRRIIIVSWVFALLAGCAANAASSRHSPMTGGDAQASGEDSYDVVASKQADQQKRITELEARIALLESESRTRRDSANRRSADTVHIGTSESVITAPRAAAKHRDASDDSLDDRNDSDSEVAEREPSRRNSKERVPTLRLYGAPKETAPMPELSSEDSKLSVVPLPEDRAKALSGADAGNVDPATAAYKSALRNLREQRYDDAIAAFAAFGKQYPQHALAANALYWSGEAHYAKRDYQHARESFDAVLSQHAQSDKVPDALVKLGLCLRRLGDEAQAKAYFKRVREKYPNTEAAVIASREGST